VSTPSTLSTIDKAFIVNRQGKDFVLYAGLVDKATERGLKRLVCRLVQAPADDNGNTAICAAEAEFADGRIFSDIGDANPVNVGKMIVMHTIRMASTRAKARVLRDALNIGGAAFEELGGDEGETETQQPEDTSAAYATLVDLQTKIHALTGEVIESPEGMNLQQCKYEYRRLAKLLKEAQASHPQGAPTGNEASDMAFIGADVPVAPSLTKTPSGPPATKEQIDRLHKLQAALGRPAALPAGLTQEAAAKQIAELVTIFNAQAHQPAGAR
jgi:hypothetical protein